MWGGQIIWGLIDRNENFGFCSMSNGGAITGFEQRSDAI